MARAQEFIRRRVARVILGRDVYGRANQICLQADVCKRLNKAFGIVRILEEGVGESDQTYQIFRVTFAGRAVYVVALPNEPGEAFEFMERAKISGMDAGAKHVYGGGFVERLQMMGAFHGFSYSVIKNQIFFSRKSAAKFAAGMVGDVRGSSPELQAQVDEQNRSYVQELALEMLSSAC